MLSRAVRRCAASELQCHLLTFHSIYHMTVCRDSINCDCVISLRWSKTAALFLILSVKTGATVNTTPSGSDYVMTSSLFWLSAAFYLQRLTCLVFFFSKPWLKSEIALVVLTAEKTTCTSAQTWLGAVWQFASNIPGCFVQFVYTRSEEKLSEECNGESLQRSSNLCLTHTHMHPNNLNR